MAGQLTVDTLRAGSGVLATQNGMTGIAKAWANWAGSTGTIASSFNVSSVTRNSTGLYTVNFTTAMPNANYATNVSANRSSASQDGYGSLMGAGTYTTSAVQVYSAFASSAALQDAPIICISVFSS